MRLLTANWPWKVGSLLVAALYWMAVASEPEMATMLRAPVQFKDAPHDLEISSPFAGSVELELTGVSGRLRAFSSAPAPVVLDFSRVRTAGERTFNIDPRVIRLPRGIQMKRAVPAQLRFVFEHRETRNVPVELRWSGTSARGLQIANVTVEPASLTVVGPQSRVSLVRSVFTDPIDLSTLKSGETVTTHPYIEEQQVRFLNFQRIHVRVELKK